MPADSAVEELDADESVGGTGLLDVDVAAGPVLAWLGVPDCGEVGGPCGRVLELEEPCGGEEEMPLGEAGVTGVYNLLNKTRISCGKISEAFRENVEDYSKTAR
jgi:hypothetical protein